MNVFWREQPLNPCEEELFNKVAEAHQVSALQGNISGQVIAMAAAGSSDYFKTLASAILTLGGLHAPITQSFRFLNNEDPSLYVPGMVEKKIMVPGWGNNIEKGGPVSKWAEVDDCLRQFFVEIHDKMCRVTKAFHALGKMIYPNPSAYTGAAAIVLGIPELVSGYLLIAGRLAAWTYFANQFLK